MFCVQNAYFVELTGDLLTLQVAICVGNMSVNFGYHAVVRLAFRNISFQDIMVTRRICLMISWSDGGAKNTGPGNYRPNTAWLEKQRDRTKSCPPHAAFSPAVPSFFLSCYFVSPALSIISIRSRNGVDCWFILYYIYLLSLKKKAKTSKVAHKLQFDRWGKWMSDQSFTGVVRQFGDNTSYKLR